MVWNLLYFIREALRSAIAHSRSCISFFGGISCHTSRHHLKKDPKGKGLHQPHFMHLLVLWYVL